MTTEILFKVAQNLTLTRKPSSSICCTVYIAIHRPSQLACEKSNRIISMTTFRKLSRHAELTVKEMVQSLAKDYVKTPASPVACVASAKKEEIAGTSKRERGSRNRKGKEKAPFSSLPSRATLASRASRIIIPFQRLPRRLLPLRSQFSLKISP